MKLTTDETIILTNEELVEVVQEYLNTKHKMSLETGRVSVNETKDLFTFRFTREEGDIPE
jgi:hypothetical protein